MENNAKDSGFVICNTTEKDKEIEQKMDEKINKKLENIKEEKEDFEFDWDEL